MRAKKNFVIVAYDVADDRRRSHVVKLLEKVGVRINYSVFECMLTDSQFEKLQVNIGAKIDSREDRIVYYPIYVGCYTKIVYQPERKSKYVRVTVV
ncbi:CRISPR-associated endonuclease Cas2 [uncultured Parabacteroides sp.]|uniref:CRISPR-associated endonuclease Cas2 n=1 Tax=uncultured Parabacteroides sp. TaxID=512312 RepID=UPI002805DFAB|nr:CRISPR-associated endonuclease Cas2 [uncultured Parabacteroides sp.]